MHDKNNKNDRNHLWGKKSVIGFLSLARVPFDYMNDDLYSSQPPGGSKCFGFTRFEFCSSNQNTESALLIMWYFTALVCSQLSVLPSHFSVGLTG